MRAASENGGETMKPKRWAWFLIAFFAAGCVVPPPAGTPEPPKVEIMMGDARALSYGSSVKELIGHPTVGEKARRLFGSDWEPGGRLASAAKEFFSIPSPSRLLRIGGAEYIATPGCLPGKCQTHRGLLLVRLDGEELLARLDEGGFAHYYAFRAGANMTPQERALVDSAWRALEPASN